MSLPSVCTPPGQGIFTLFDMKNILIFVLWSGWCYGLQAQTITFTTFHDLSTWVSNRGSSVENVPNGYAFLTLSGCTPAVGSSGCTGLGITDIYGNLLHKKTFERFIGEGLRYRPQDSTFFIWGERATPNSGGDWSVVLVKTTFWGDTIWSFQYNEDNFDWCRNIVELPDGSILMACAFRDADKGAKLAKLSADGQLLWTKSYDTGNAFRVYDPKGILDLGDGTVMMSALGLYVDSSTQIPPLPNTGISLFKIDYDGNLIWGTAYQTGENALRPANPRLVQLTGGQLITAIAYEELGPLGCYNGCASFIRVNPDGSIKKIADYPDDHVLQTINDFAAMPDGNIIACEVGGFEVYGKWDAYPLISKLSPEGKFIWERWLPLDMAYVVGDVKATPDGGCIVIGTQERPRPGGGYEYYAALIKLDGEGCLVPNCDSLLVISPVREAPVMQSQVLIWPNPGMGRLQVFVPGIEVQQSVRLRVTDVSGRVVLEQNGTTSDGNLLLDGSGLTPGIYLCQVRTDSDAFAPVKFVISL